MFLLDSSTSVSQINFEKMLTFTREFVLHFNIDSGDVRVGIVRFSTDSQVQFHLHDYHSKPEMLKAISNIKYFPGNTNTAAGIRTMRQVIFSEKYGDRIDVPNYAIILTDGVSNIDSKQTTPEALKAKNVGVEIFVIGIDLTDMKEVNSIASEPLGKHRFIVNSFDNLNQINGDLFSEICLGICFFSRWCHIAQLL